MVHHRVMWELYCAKHILESACQWEADSVYTEDLSSSLNSVHTSSCATLGMSACLQTSFICKLRPLVAVASNWGCLEGFSKIHIVRRCDAFSWSPAEVLGSGCQSNSQDAQSQASRKHQETIQDSLTTPSDSRSRETAWCRPACSRLAHPTLGTMIMREKAVGMDRREKKLEIKNLYLFVYHMNTAQGCELGPSTQLRLIT